MENRQQCKKCNLIKPRVHAGYFPNTNKKFSDETGRLWNGRVCPDCQALKARVNMHRYRHGIIEK